MMVGRLHNISDLNVNSDICLTVTEENFAVELINNLVLLQNVKKLLLLL